MLQRILNSCLPDTATQDDIFRALTRQTDNQSPQDKTNFEAIVKDGGQDRDVSLDFEEFMVITETNVAQTMRINHRAEREQNNSN